MAEIVISDECLAPDKYVYFNYSGPDPWAVVNHINDMARQFFHLGTSDWLFQRLNWDISGDPIDFWAVFKAKRELSGRSLMWIYIRVQGKKSKTDNIGKFTMRLNAEVRTQIEGPKIILLPLWYLYSYLFFNKVRRNFLQRCTSTVLGFRDEIKRYYDVQVVEGPEKEGAFG